MAITPRWKLRFIDLGRPMNTTRADLEANAWTIEKALTATQGLVAQIASLVPQAPGRTQTIIGRDTDGVPYFDPVNALAQPVQMGLDVDGTPYYIDWSVTL